MREMPSAVRHLTIASAPFISFASFIPLKMKVESMIA